MKIFNGVSKKVKRLVIISSLSIVGVFTLLSFSSTSYFEVAKNLDIYATLFKELNTYYVDDIEPSTLMRTSIDAMLHSLDPYTSYISEAEIENYRLQTTGKYGGIGSLIRNIGDYIIIAEPYEGFPADKGGLLAGDRLLTIGDESIVNKNTEEVSKLLKGQAGTNVDVTIERLQSDGSYKNFAFTLTREEIVVPNVPYYGFVENDIAYVRLSNFTERAGAEVRDALEALKTEKPDIKGIIFDLRGNPGGLLNEAVNVSNAFVDKGELIVSTKGKIPEWDKTFKTLNPAVDTDLPLAVLINGGSASASEIVSGSIQDLDRGIIVGQKSFGKGLVQTTRSLTYNTKLKVTTAKYYIPSGRCIQAINYADRDKDGSVAKMPDSLRTPFKTSVGRVVYDGGGIWPDVETESQKLSNITLSLLSANLIFDYATIYHSRNEKINSSFDFHINDEDFNQFVEWISDKKYDYSTKSEEIIEELEKISKGENYYDALSQDIDNLRKGIAHDKKKDVQKHKIEIIELIEEEIVSRYYHRKGQIEASFDNDNDIIEAVKFLKSPEDYRALFEPAE